MSESFFFLSDLLGFGFGFGDGDGEGDGDGDGDFWTSSSFSFSDEEDEQGLDEREDPDCCGVSFVMVNIYTSVCQLKKYLVIKLLL